ncbi:hypothetical protein IWQ55_001492 [Labrenzia sp. EL_208]|nr:hypothetical protein [Labrenzia sp. EL_208]
MEMSRKHRHIYMLSLRDPAPNALESTGRMI